MITLSMELPDKSYPIHIENGLLAHAGTHLRSLYDGQKIAVVSDETVFAHHGSVLLKSLTEAGYQPYVRLIPPGEGSKSLEQFGRLCEDFASIGLVRSDLIIAFGGGVVGDLAGFAAAAYMRGTPFVQIPTTLLAQVDSSVGGKTGINLAYGKNLVGAFWQPQMVLIDPLLLATLETRHLLSGLAEVIKYGAIAAPDLIEQLEVFSLRDMENQMEAIIHRCCSIKRGIVERDERDFGERMMLNYGHTVGHAIESIGHYDTHFHGEAVGIGMVIAARIGEGLGITEAGTSQRLATLLKRFGMKTTWMGSRDDLKQSIRLDKKNSNDKLTFVLLERIGSAGLYQLQDEQLDRVLLEALS